MIRHIINNTFVVTDGVVEMTIHSPVYGPMIFRFSELDLPKIQTYHWRVLPTRPHKRTSGRSFYAITGQHRDGNTRLLHKLILPCTFPDMIDHIDGDTQNNVIDNLRVVTHSKNQQNQTRSKGYTWNKRLCKFAVTIQAMDSFGVIRKYHYGLFDTEDQARVAVVEVRKLRAEGLLEELKPTRTSNEELRSTEGWHDITVSNATMADRCSRIFGVAIKHARIARIRKIDGIEPSKRSN